MQEARVPGIQRCTINHNLTTPRSFCCPGKVISTRATFSTFVPRKELLKFISVSFAVHPLGYCSLENGLEMATFQDISDSRQHVYSVRSPYSAAHTKVSIIPLQRCPPPVPLVLSSMVPCPRWLLLPPCDALHVASVLQVFQVYIKLL